MRFSVIKLRYVLFYNKNPSASLYKRERVQLIHKYYLHIFNSYPELYSSLMNYKSTFIDNARFSHIYDVIISRSS